MTEPKEKSANSRVREWVREAIATREDFNIPVLVDECIADLGGDASFVRTLLQENLKPLVYSVIQMQVGQSRHLVALGDDVVQKGEVAKRATRISAFASWLEHAGDRHVQLLEMTREDLLIAAAEREQRGQHELGIAKLWRSLANKLEGGQKVSEVFSAEEIEKLQLAQAKRKVKVA